MLGQREDSWALDLLRSSELDTRESALATVVVLGAAEFAADMDGRRNKVVREEVGPVAALPEPTTRFEEEEVRAGSSFTADVLMEPAFEA